LLKFTESVEIDAFGIQ